MTECMSEPRMTYPKWMNDVLASDIGRELERREAAAHAEQRAVIDVMLRWIESFPYPTEEQDNR